MKFRFGTFRWSRVRQTLFRILFVIYILLVLFALLNFKSRVRYETATMFADPVFTINLETTRCRLDLSSLGLVSLNIFDRPSLDLVESANQNVEMGGKWSPNDCEAWQRVAIIVPYRDRYEHLILLLRRLHPMLQKQKIYYRIFVIEQVGEGKFNRGRLLNIGVTESLKYDSYDCFIFHDVDLLPEHDQNVYYCDGHAHHLASAINEMRYHSLYFNYAGGVIAVSKENIFRINGHSNDYWGWGNEDDDFNARTEAVGLLLTRPPEHIGRYKMVRHQKLWRADHGHDLFLTWRSRWKDDGLNSLDASKYSVVSKEELKLYTNITVNLGLPPSELPSVVNVTKESLVWFLMYYFP